MVVPGGAQLFGVLWKLSQNGVSKKLLKDDVDICEPIPKLETQNSDASGMLLANSDSAVHGLRALLREVAIVTPLHWPLPVSVQGVIRMLSPGFSFWNLSTTFC